MSEPLTRLTAVAAALPLDNVDTDMIWPAMPGAPLTKGVQANQAFHRLRFTSDGAERPDFVLNREPWRHAQILIAGDNFGCGSSREMAVWALAEWGLRCIVAPRFGDIFYTNCTLNGVLPIRLPRSEVDRLMTLAADPNTATMTVDLAACIIAATGFQSTFAIAERARQGLLKGLDGIGLTLAMVDEINSFGERYLTAQPWAGSIRADLLG